MRAPEFQVIRWHCALLLMDSVNVSSQARINVLFREMDCTDPRMFPALKFSQMFLRLKVLLSAL
jgi:hypothetical protein